MQSLTASPLRLAAFVACASTLALLLVACKSSPNASTEASAPPPTTITCAAAGAATKNVTAPTAIDSTCAQIPYAPALFKTVEGGYSANQTTADMYSWLSFVALNWPVNPATCAPDPTQSILTNPSSPTWMTYLTTDDVFKTSGAPDPWCGASAPNGAKGLAAVASLQAARLPTSVRALAAAHPEIHLFLSHDSKSGELVSSLHALHALAAAPTRMQAILQSTDLPIVDQNGRYARFTVSMNSDEASFITKNTLYTKAGQTKYGNVTFPVSDSSKGVMGVIELKAAWKILGPGDNPANFFTQQAIVYNDSTGKPSPGPNPVTVGLIGLHILHKSQGQSMWAWSTFEQTDNDTTSFFNPNCKAPIPNPNNHCVVNATTIPSKLAKTAPELSPTGKPLQFPTQIQPKSYIVPSNPQYDAAFQSLLASTPWAHYKLVSTQWFAGAVGLVPQYLGATVQETFVPQNDSTGHPLDSCANCHQGAQDPGGHSAEFSFILYDAQQ
ncbi:hypothetical protein GOB94_07665 [Granulicella sp. 5B5]|uniref:hypothetical protein n=1 Tax=Granulicella sp. 5B5 TaxID=1617967 RepID=UPI0015F5E088|nr:hypothetical protein [Granulicella sp. 5B5]QMV18576.1 hypothetical protein GOB94_07665 [Granulicella sp. 5B5]